MKTGTFLLGICFVAVLPCLAKELDRPFAKKLIVEATSGDVVETVPMDTRAFDRAREDGLWLANRGSWVPSRKGQKIFRSITIAYIELVTPLKRKISAVTGITDGEQPGITKVANFTWHFVELPEPVSQYAGVTNQDHSGVARFRLYDDGWRVSGVQFASPMGGENTRPLKKMELRDLVSAGSYQGVMASKRITVATWREESGRLVGVVYYPHEGFEQGLQAPVGLIEKGSYDTKSGAMHFLVKIRPAKGSEFVNYEFAGKVDGEVLRGTFLTNGTKHSINLEKSGGRPPEYDSVEEWEKEWASEVMAGWT